MDQIKNPNIYDATLIRLLQFGGEFRATDPGDHIYGLFGMATDVKDLGLVADYDRSAEDVYVQVTTLLIKNTRSLELLQMAGVGKCKHTESTLSIPSWVSDYSGGVFFDWQSNMWKYAAGMSRVATPRFVNRTVSLQGWIGDRINRLGSGSYHPPGPWHQWLTGALDVAATTHPSGLTELAFETLWRTLIGNIDYDNGCWQMPAPTHYGRYFTKFRAIYLHPKYAQKSWEEASAEIYNDPAISYRDKQEGFKKQSYS